MADRNVKVTIEVIDKAKAGLSNISAQTKKASAELKRMDSDTKKAAGSIGGLGASLKTLAAGYLSFKTLQLGFREFQEAIKSQQIESSFNRMAQAAGIASSELVNGLRDASVGTVAATDLMLSANRAMALGVGKDLNTMTTLMEIARVKGQAMGLTTTQAFDNIVTGIGRASPLILDNLGITIKQQEAQELYAAKLGKSAEALTDAEKKNAILNAVLEEGTRQLELYGEVAVTPAERMQQLNALWNDATDALFRGLIPGFEDLSGAITDGSLKGEEYERVMRSAAHAGFVLGKTLEAVVRVVGFAGDAMVGLGKTTQAVIQKATTGFLVVADAVTLGMNDSVGELRKNLNELADESLDDAIDKGGDIKESWKGIGETLFDLGTGFDEYYEQSKKALESSIAFGDGATEANDSAAQSAEDAKKELEELEKGFKEIKDSTKQFALESIDDFAKFTFAIMDTSATNKDYISTAKAGFKELQSAIDATGSEINKLEDDLKKAQTAFDDFVKGSTDQATSDFARIIVDAEQKLPELKKQLSEAQSSGGDSDRINDLRKQIQEQKDILKTAKTDEIENFAGLQEELKFLRDQAGRNELEQALALFERKIEAKRKEFEEEKKMIEGQIEARKEELAAMQTIQTQMSNLLEINVNRRLGKVSEETSAIYGQVSALNALVSAYLTLAAVQSGSSTSTKTSGRREMGGAVSAGKSYLVGESGPETFTPNRSGVIESSKGKSITVNVNNPVVRDDRDIRTIANAVRDIISREDELTKFGAN